MNATKKQDLDWGSLGFSYLKTDFRFKATYKNGVWSEGEMVTDEVMSVHEGSTVMHYGQSCFEGLKAQTAQDGRILLFRPDLNNQRMQESAERLLMPKVPTELFMKGIESVIRSNLSWVPPYGSGAAFYIRPILMGLGENMGLRPAPEYEFRVFASPVGPYYKSGGLNVISLAVIDIDRAAPLGLGHYKVGANYAGGLLATRKAQALGANEALYLDPKERKYLEEAGSANIVMVLKGKRFATPKSSSILPSVTRRAIMTLAEKELGFSLEERPIDFLAEQGEIEEMAACGTAAVLSPIGKLLIDGTWHQIGTQADQPGPVMSDLYQRLTSLQRGEREDPYGWTYSVKLD
ncbi:MAG: branched-chain amino acid aminotransferase [bacterium]|nr:branched-chain amino acid aminotransferase [bacterium]